MKHIEQILPEYAAFELDRIGREETDATASAALTALLHNVTGCAIPPTADLPESEVEELVPLCLSILRRHWTTPLTALGDGTTPMSLADLLRRLIGDRVQGNEAWSIPPANADIPTAVAALRDRKIGGVPEAEDGISLVNLMCSSTAANTITKLDDPNDGWTYDKAKALNDILAKFPNITEVTIGCGKNTVIVLGENATIQKVTFSHLKEAAAVVFEMTTSYTGNFASLTEVNFPELETCKSLINKGGQSGWYNIGFLALTTLTLPKLKKILSGGSHIAGCFIGETCATLTKLEMLELEEVNAPIYGASTLQGLTELRMPKLKKWNAPFSATYNASDSGLPNLLLLEVGAVETNMDIRYWSPTLDSSNLQQFLANFKTYIAQRLTDKGSGLTLTLSQAVRDAIQQDPEIVSIITSKGWTISPAPSV